MGTFTKPTATEINGGAFMLLKFFPSTPVSLLALKHFLTLGLYFLLDKLRVWIASEEGYMYVIKQRSSLCVWKWELTVSAVTSLLQTRAAKPQLPSQLCCACSPAPWRWANSGVRDEESPLHLYFGAGFFWLHVKHPNSCTRGNSEQSISIHLLPPSCSFTHLNVLLSCFVPNCHKGVIDSVINKAYLQTS